MPTIKPAFARHALRFVWVASAWSLAACGPTRTPPPPEYKVQWLGEHALRLRSIEPADDDYSDLDPLKEILGEARIVLLGEISHGDGATFLAKTRLIQFLHREMGFDVLAFESGLYDCAKAWDLIRNGEEARAAMQKAVFPLWTNSEQVQPLMAYVGEMAGGERPLELAGFDSAFTGTASQTYLVGELEAFLAEWSLPAQGRAGWTAFTAIMDDLTRAAYQSGGKIPPYGSQREAFLTTLATLRSEIEEAAGPAGREASFWLQVLESAETHATYLWQVLDTHKMIEYSLQRDRQMGENLLWLAEEYYPERKIIVWAASVHLARNLDELESLGPEEPGLEPKPEVMGDVLWDALGEQIYALGATAYTGSTGPAFKPAVALTPASEGSFEDLMNQAGIEHGLVDLRHIPPGGEWLSDRLVSRPFGYVEEMGDWTRVLDGLIFIREMVPSQGVLSD